MERDGILREREIKIDIMRKGNDRERRIQREKEFIKTSFFKTEH